MMLKPFEVFITTIQFLLTIYVMIFSAKGDVNLRLVGTAVFLIFLTGAQLSLLAKRIQAPPVAPMPKETAQHPR